MSFDITNASTAVHAFGPFEWYYRQTSLKEFSIKFLKQGMYIYRLWAPWFPNWHRQPDSVWHLENPHLSLNVAEHFLCICSYSRQDLWQMISAQTETFEDLGATALGTIKAATSSMLCHHPQHSIVNSIPRQTNNRHRVTFWNLTI